MDKAKIKKTERIFYWVMLALLVLTLGALLLHYYQDLAIGYVAVLALLALISSALHRACLNRISGKTLFGRKLGEKKKNAKKNKNGK